MYNTLAVISSFIIPLFILRKEINNRKNIETLIIYISFAIGFITRLILIVNFPNGLNVDEASSRI